MLVIQPLDKEGKLKMTLKEAKAVCEGRHDIYRDRSPCDNCMFHDKDGCQIEGRPIRWLEDRQ